MHCGIMIKKELGIMEWDLQIEQLPMIFVEQSSEDATNHNIIIVDLEVAKTSLLYK